MYLFSLYPSVVIVSCLSIFRKSPSHPSTLVKGKLLCMDVPLIHPTKAPNNDMLYENDYLTINERSFNKTLKQ